MASFLQAIDVGLRADLFSKFQSILSLPDINKGVIYYPKEIAMKKMAEKRDNTELEFINLWRTDIGLDWSKMRTPAARRGIFVTTGEEGDTDSTLIKAVPAKLGYDVWFWTRDKDKLNLIAETYLFWIQDDPNLDLEYLDIYPMGLDLHFGELIDESTERTMHDTGTYYVYRTHITVDGWIFTTPATNSDVIQTIRLKIYDKDDLTEANYEEIIDENDSDHDSELTATLLLSTKIIT